MKENLEPAKVHEIEESNIEKMIELLSTDVRELRYQNLESFEKIFQTMCDSYKSA